MGDKAAVLARLNDNFLVHRRNFALRLQVFKEKAAHATGWPRGRWSNSHFDGQGLTKIRGYD